MTTLAAWVEKGIWILAVGIATNGVVEEPTDTLTKGSLESFAIYGAGQNAELGTIVTKAEPSASVVIGTYNLVDIWYI